MSLEFTAIGFAVQKRDYTFCDYLLENLFQHQFHLIMTVFHFCIQRYVDTCLNQKLFQGTFLSAPCICKQICTWLSCYCNYANVLCDYTNESDVLCVKL